MYFGLSYVLPSLSLGTEFTQYTVLLCTVQFARTTTHSFVKYRK